MTLFTTKLGETICLDLLLTVGRLTAGEPDRCEARMIGQVGYLLIRLVPMTGDWREAAKLEHARLLREWEKVKLEVVR